MSVVARLTAFLAGLAALAALGFGFGRLLDVGAPGASAEPAGHAEPTEAAAGDSHGAGEAHGDGRADAAHGGGGDHPVGGLGVAENGLRLVVADRDFAQGATERLRFQIVDAEGEPLTAFDVTHTKPMHVIVARRDLSGFQHLHPRMAANGTWTVPLRLAEAGTYRVFADFSHRGEGGTLADDIWVDGAADLRELPAPATSALSRPGGYEVALRSGGAHAGAQVRLRFQISRDGRPAPLQPYLGAGGHLVALREGDLAFLHVHPVGDAGRDGSIEFEATFPSAGRYRLFLQFMVDGELQTVAFSEEVH